MKSLANKNIVITGAASGVGKKMALLLARKGANLAIVSVAQVDIGSSRAGRSNGRDQIRKAYS